MTLDPSDRRIRDEIDHHLEELEEHLTDQGLSEDEARGVNPRTSLLVNAFDRLRPARLRRRPRA
jgi:hypothetical protein